MKLSKEKLAAMLAAAEKATPVPGFDKWICLFGERTIYTRDPSDGVRTHPVVRADDASHPALPFVTLCDPQTITAILTELLEFRNQADALSGDSGELVPSHGALAAGWEITTVSRAGYGVTWVTDLAGLTTDIDRLLETEGVLIWSILPVAALRLRSAAIERLTVADDDGEAEILAEQVKENMELIDWISDKIGLPGDVELSRSNFTDWSERLTVESGESGMDHMSLAAHLAKVNAGRPVIESESGAVFVHRDVAIEAMQALSLTAETNLARGREASEWRLIETAKHEDHHKVMGAWTLGGGEWVRTPVYFSQWDRKWRCAWDGSEQIVTHWQPLPAPPTLEPGHHHAE